jgi:acyl-CoA synthetase (AMP-forming)/AMP-acid ligase II
MRLHEPLDFAALSNPDLPFAISDSQVLTYKPAAEKVGRIATALVHSGLGPGDRVALIAKNSIEFALLYFACSKAKVVLVPINYRLAAPEFAFILNDSQAAAVFAGKEFLAAIDQCRPGLATLRTFVALESEPAPAGWLAFEQWLGEISEISNTTAANPPAVQMYTSGTTGRPKGAILGQQSLMGTAQACQT